jgi:AraC-like DNA-binding protein
MAIVRIGFPPLGATLRCGGQRFDSDIAQGRALTPQLAVVWVLDGVVDHVDHRGARHRLGPGDAFHRYPLQVHEVRFLAGARTRWIAVPAEGLPLMRAVGTPCIDEPVFRAGLHADLERRWAVLERELARTPKHRRGPLAGRLLEAIAELHQRAALPRNGDAGMVALMERAALRLARVEGPRLRLTALARSLGLSYRTFRRAFAAVAGIAPEAYRIRCRIAAAQELLRAADEPIGEVARRLGYRDGADFARQFARMVGLPPRRFRREGVG